MVAHKFYDTFYGEPVGMNVRNTHEYRNHQAAVVEVFIFIDFFNHHYATVGRSYHRLFGLALVMTQRTSEKVNDNAVNQRRKDSNDPEEHHATIFAQIIKRTID
jgi:hypothetical protein